VSELLEQMKLLNEDHKPDGWPAVRMSEINALVSMIKSQGEQLSKANERVKELDQENKEFTMLIANLVRRDDVKTDLLQNPTFEKASVQLNKFAIEKKIEGMQRVLDCRELNLSQGEIDTIKLMQEQLSKGVNDE